MGKSYLKQLAGSSGVMNDQILKGHDIYILSVNVYFNRVICLVLAILVNCLFVLTTDCSKILMTPEWEKTQRAKYNTNDDN